MKIVCLSDTHMHHKKIIMPKTDMIIHAGDFTYRGEFDEVKKFLTWYGEQQAKYKVLICGNHEVGISKQPFDLLKTMCENEGIQLLCNSHTTIEGIKIYGSPYSNKFGHGWAYNATEELLAQMYVHIDPDVNVIVTHGPAKNRLDWCPNGNVGSQSLADWINTVPEKLLLHVTGHIHESRGVAIHKTNTYNYVTVNASICGIPYTDIVINPIAIEL
jgi:Icc-related predicted phosphoesterase